MGNIGVWGWDYAALPAYAQWRKLHVDLAGDLQVDVLTAGPTEGHCHGYDGAAWQKLLVESVALHNLRVRLYDGASGIDSQLVDTDMTTERGIATCSAVYGYLSGNAVKKITTYKGNDDDIDGNRYCLAVGCFLLGYDGSNWDRLRTESPTAFNLRVKLYDGANGIDSSIVTTSAFVSTGLRGLLTYSLSGLYKDATVVTAIKAAISIGDADAGNYSPTVALMGYNGATWDRLRAYGTGILKVGHAVFGNIYSKTMTMVNDAATRFEVAAKKLRDVVIIVKTHPMLLGETGVEVYPVGANETIGFTKVDISTLYFKNAGAGNNGVITILGVEE